MKNQVKKLLLASSVLVTVSGQANAQTGEEKLQDLVDSIVVVDGSMDDGHISSTMLTAYLDAVDQVMEHDYATATTAEQLFIQEHVASMNNLALAVDTLVDATDVLMTATSVAEVAMEADTAPEQVALQDMLATDEYSIDAGEVCYL